MPVPELTLFFAPGSCSRVPNIVLEEIGADFDARIVKFMAGEHRSEEYLRLNPKGKVPLLLVNGVPVTENAAIQIALARLFPESRVLPFRDEPIFDAQIIADLIWCASGIHPIITRLRLPQFFSSLEEASPSIVEAARQAMKPNFEIIDRRLEATPWMLGSEWSSLDAYVFWIWTRVDGSAFDLTPYGAYRDHFERMMERPAVQRALLREANAQQWLEDQGLAVPASPPASHAPGGSHGVMSATTRID